MMTSGTTRVTVDVPNEWLDRIGEAVRKVPVYGKAEHRYGAPTCISRLVWDEARGGVDVMIHLTAREADEVAGAAVAEMPGHTMEQRVHIRVGAALRQRGFGTVQPPDPPLPMIAGNDTFPHDGGEVWRCVNLTRSVVIVTNDLYGGGTWHLTADGRGPGSNQPDSDTPLRLALLESARRVHAMPWDEEER